MKLELVLKDKLSIPLSAKVIALEADSVVMRVVNNTTELNGKLLETTTGVNNKLKSSEVPKIDDILIFDADGNFISKDPKPSKQTKSATTSTGRTGSNKPMKNI